MSEQKPSQMDKFLSKSNIIEKIAKTTPQLIIKFSCWTWQNAINIIRKKDLSLHLVMSNLNAQD